MLLLSGLIISVFVLFVIAIQIDTYNKIIFHKYRFQYFALRDRLAMLVVNSKLDEDSWEYQEIVDTINFHINVTETMSISKIISLFAQYHLSPEEECNVKIIKRKLNNEEVIDIMADFMEITGSLLERNSRMQMRFLAWLAARKRPTKHINEMRAIANHKVALDRIYSYRDELRRACGAKVAIA